MLDAKSERGAHQGVIAEAEPYPFATLDAVLARAEGKKHSLIIALDHITDPGNLGAVVRTAEVVGADGVLVAKRRSAAVTAAAYKSSAGALAHVLLAQEANLVRSLERCKKEAGYWVAGASEHAEQTAWDAPLEGRVVLVMGSEGEGLARLTRETCDFLVACRGGQGRLAQRRAGGDRARRTSGCAATRCRVVTAVRTLIVDGYNVIRQTPPYKTIAEDDLDASRLALISDVSAFAHGEFGATVVFDGHNNPGSDGQPHSVAGVTVIFSRYGHNADSVIESLSRAAREAARTWSSSRPMPRLSGRSWVGVSRACLLPSSPVRSVPRMPSGATTRPPAAQRAASRTASTQRSETGSRAGRAVRNSQLSSFCFAYCAAVAIGAISAVARGLGNSRAVSLLGVPEFASRAGGEPSMRLGEAGTTRGVPKVHHHSGTAAYRSGTETRGRHRACCCRARWRWNASCELVRRYRGLIRSKARSYFLVGADRDDVIQEGMVGLFKAIRDYDPTRQAASTRSPNCASRARSSLR